MTVLLVVAGVLAAVLVPVALHERRVIEDATSLGGFLVTRDVRDAIDATNGVAGVYFLVFVAIAVLWMIWMWRAATNTALLRRYKPRFANGFAIGGWFIPLANLIIPGMHMYDIQRGSGPPLRPGERAPKGSGLLVVWWIVFVAGWVGSVTGQVTVKNGHRYDASDFATRNAIFVVAMVAIVAAAVLAIIVVRSITRDQHDAWDAMTAGRPADPYGVAGPWGPPGAPVPEAAPVPPPPPAYPPAAPPAEPAPPAVPPVWPDPGPSDP
jgi:hypothetical protein